MLNKHISDNDTKGNIPVKGNIKAGYEGITRDAVLDRVARKGFSLT